jgi:hypothetical protein
MYVVNYDIVHKLLKKNSVSKFDCIIAKGFYHLNFTIFLNVADVIFEVEIQCLRPKNY